jgi:hypothetical protein
MLPSFSSLKRQVESIDFTECMTGPIIGTVIKIINKLKQISSHEPISVLQHFILCVPHHLTMHYCIIHSYRHQIEAYTS